MLYAIIYSKVVRKRKDFKIPYPIILYSRADYKLFFYFIEHFTPKGWLKR